MEQKTIPRKIEEFNRYVSVLQLNGCVNAVTECLQNALEKLDEKDSENLNRILINFPNIKGCGQVSQLELLAKLGLFLSSEEHK